MFDLENRLSENKQKNGTIIYVPNHIQEYINDRDNKGTL